MFKYRTFCLFIANGSFSFIIEHKGFLIFAISVCLFSSCPPLFLFQHALDLQLAVANILQSLVHTERNQQVMCEAGLHARLLQRCSTALADEDHSLHPPLQRMFERLASQALQPMVLRSDRQHWSLVEMSLGACAVTGRKWLGLVESNKWPGSSDHIGFCFISH